MDDVLSVPQGDFTLRRDHHRPGPLRAWDAADEYLLSHLADEDVAASTALVVNDGFGALAVALAAGGTQVTSWSDSCVAMAAAAANVERNGLDPRVVRFVPSTETPTDVTSPGPIDLVLVKIPRTLALLDDQLRRLVPLLGPRSLVMGGAMTKAVHRSTIETFERSLGPTPTSRARKKARLLTPTLDPGLATQPPEPPLVWNTPDGVTVTSHPSVFSAERLDAGTRLLLAHLPQPDSGAVVVDLGCGNGVVAATIARHHPDVTLVCCDESHLAIASARSTVRHPGTTFHVTDGLDGIGDRSADLVVVNPPFHAGGARTTDVARRMFEGARRVLRPGGEIRVVGNRHLDHHVQLKRRFDHVRVVGSDSKFVVVSARARR